MVLWHSSGVVDLILPDHCEPQYDSLRYISSSFNTCIPTYFALISTLLGSLSILAWLFAQLPQIYKNYELKSTTGLSIVFLVQWCLGDSTNLAGAVLTNQATWQIIVASYYTFVDCVLVYQFIYFTFYRREVKARALEANVSGGSQSPRHPESSSRAIARPINRPRRPLDDFRYPGSISPLGLEKSIPGPSRTFLRHPAGSSSLASPKTVLMLSMVLALLSRTQASPLPSSSITVLVEETPRQIIGRFVSWSSTALYLVSRLPQLYKNWKRKSTAGLSISLFIAAFFGNLFYSTSLLTNPLAWESYPAYGLYGWAGSEGSDRESWRSRALPFLLGASGVLALDAAVAFQFWIYGGGNQTIKMIAVQDDDGRKHWERVSGWMKGFIPSPNLMPIRSMPRTIDTEDSRSLLRPTPIDGRNYGGIQPA